MQNLLHFLRYFHFNIQRYLSTRGMEILENCSLRDKCALLQIFTLESFLVMKYCLVMNSGTITLEIRWFLRRIKMYIWKI